MHYGVYQIERFGQNRSFCALWGVGEGGVGRAVNEALLGWFKARAASPKAQRRGGWRIVGGYEENMIHSTLKV
jgi:hypothetical protein